MPYKFISQEPLQKSQPECLVHNCMILNGTQCVESKEKRKANDGQLRAYDVKKVKTEMQMIGSPLIGMQGDMDVSLHLYYVLLAKPRLLIWRVATWLRDNTGATRTLTITVIRTSNGARAAWRDWRWRQRK